MNNERDLHHSPRQAALLPFKTRTEKCCVDLSGVLSAQRMCDELVFVLSVLLGQFYDF